MESIRIRDYTEADLRGIVRIYNEAFSNLPSCWPNPMTPRWFMKRFGPALHGEAGTAFVADYEGMLVGYVLVITLRRSEVGLVALISGICVVPSFQRRGIGSRLMECAIDWAKGQGAVLIENDDEIVENLGAVSFFEKMGFEVFHRGAYMSKNPKSIEVSRIPEKYGIRKLRAEDLDQLLKVRREAFKEFGPWYSKPDGEGFKRRMRSRIRSDDARVLVAVMNNRVVGYVVCSVSETDGSGWDIRNISVLPRYRNSGVGTALINRAFNFLKSKRIETLSTATETAEAFYEEVGFKVDKRFVRVRKWI